MPTELIVNNTTFQYPVQGEDPGWGGEATDWATEVTTVLNSLLSPDDILQTLFIIQNGVTSLSNITGMIFDKTSARTASISYSIYRATATESVIESGSIRVTYNTSTDTWDIQREFVGDAGVQMDITNDGQVQYTSSTLSGATYTAEMKFRAVALQQEI